MNDNIDLEYIYDFEKKQQPFMLFYKEKVTNVKINFIYIDLNNEIYNIKSFNETINESVIPYERILYLIKNNQINIDQKYKLLSIIKFNIDIDNTEIKNFLVDDNYNDNYNFTFFIKSIDEITFNDTIKFFMRLNSVTFIFKQISQNNENNQDNQNSNQNNTTKKIILYSNKTRRKRF